MSEAKNPNCSYKIDTDNLYQKITLEVTITDILKDSQYELNQETTVENLQLTIKFHNEMFDVRFMAGPYNRKSIYRKEIEMLMINDQIVEVDNDLFDDIISTGIRYENSEWLTCWPDYFIHRRMTRHDSGEAKKSIMIRLTAIQADMSITRYNLNSLQSITSPGIYSSIEKDSKTATLTVRVRIDDKYYQSESVDNFYLILKTSTDHETIYLESCVVQELLYHPKYEAKFEILKDNKPLKSWEISQDIGTQMEIPSNFNLLGDNNQPMFEMSKGVPFVTVRFTLIKKMTFIETFGI